MIFARIVRFLLVAGLLATGFIYLQPVKLAVGSKPEFASYQVSAKDLELSCNGGAILAGGESGTSVTNFERVGSALASVSYSASQNTKLAGFIGNTILGYGIRQDLSTRIKTASSVKVIDASGTTEQGSQLLTANQYQLAEDKSIRGLLAAPCLRPQSEFWFVGGSTSIAKFRKTSSKYSDVQNMLRVFVPGEKDASITFQVLGTDAQTFGTVLSVTAPAGKVSDFAIEGLKNGDYFGILNSDVEVLSSVRLVRAKATGDRFVDFAWLNSANGFSNTRFAAVPKSGITKLSLVNISSKATTVTLKLGAATIKRSVQAASAEVVLVGAGLGVGIIPSSANIYANLIIDSDGRVAALPVLDEKNISGQVEVNIH